VNNAAGSGWRVAVKQSSWQVTSALLSSVFINGMRIKTGFTAATGVDPPPDYLRDLMPNTSRHCPLLRTTKRKSVGAARLKSRRTILSRCTQTSCASNSNATRRNTAFGLLLLNAVYRWTQLTAIHMF